ncbi:hypothetical protein AX16_000653 [Volvariella volvacea WC 439]|nr:hypothetical protein AX16_000653 [Volvariella volvacea WC 439]
MRYFTCVLLLNFSISFASSSLLTARQKPIWECVEPCDALDDDIECNPNDAECHCTNLPYLELFRNCIVEMCDGEAEQDMLNNVNSICEEYNNPTETEPDPDAPTPDPETSGIEEAPLATEETISRSIPTSSDTSSSVTASSQSYAPFVSFPSF